MGLVKQWMEEQYERGFAQIDGYICVAHILDDVLIANLQEQSPAACAVCARTDRPVVALDDVGAKVKEAIDFFWEPGYFGHDSELDGLANDTVDVVYDVCAGVFTDDEYGEIAGSIEQAIDDATGGSGWMWDRQQGLEWSWDLYSDNVRHTNRFVFPQPGTGHSRHPAPQHTADFLDQILTYVQGDLDLVKREEAGLSFFRGRLAETTTDFTPNAQQLGPAPSTRAAANRMSPPGVSLFYGSEDPQTAIAEIAGHGPEPLAIMGEFKSTRALFILDLTSTTAPPGSVFDPDKRPAIAMWQFLQTFIDKITQPVIPDGREHIEYTPTQVLTEYIRWMSTTQVDGIALPSRPGGGKKTYVLFIGPTDVADAPGGVNHWLTLAPDAVTIYDVQRTYHGQPHRTVSP